jgi:hypothetical protein
MAEMEAAKIECEPSATANGTEYDPLATYLVLESRPSLRTAQLHLGVTHRTVSTVYRRNKEQKAP